VRHTINIYRERESSVFRKDLDGGKGQWQVFVWLVVMENNFTDRENLLLSEVIHLNNTGRHNTIPMPEW
jgi:hypothetical protein